MVTCRTSNCPKCGGDLKHYDVVLRVVRTKGGSSKKIKIRRLRCILCKKMHREIPDMLCPYKHYESEIIKGVLEGYITPDTIGYEDCPSEITMCRWKRENRKCFYEDY